MIVLNLTDRNDVRTSIGITVTSEHSVEHSIETPATENHATIYLQSIRTRMNYRIITSAEELWSNRRRQALRNCGAWLPRGLFTVTSHGMLTHLLHSWKFMIRAGIEVVVFRLPGRCSTTESPSILSSNANYIGEYCELRKTRFWSQSKWYDFSRTWMKLSSS